MALNVNERRIHSIDTFRVLAILAIICGHSRTFADLTSIPWLHPAFMSASRFAVPFFFITAGYFFGRKVRAQGPSLALYTDVVTRLACLAAVWGAFYCCVPNGIIARALHAKHGIPYPPGPYPYGAFNFQMTAVQPSHIWFLTALISGISLLWLLLRLKAEKWALPIGALFYLALVITGPYEQALNVPLKINYLLWRFGPMFSMLFVSLGWLLSAPSQKRPATRVAVTITAIGLILQLTEFWYLHRHYGIQLCDNDGQFGTVPLALGLFLLALSRPSWGSGTPLPVMGQLTLGVYVTHLFFNHNFVGAKPLFAAIPQAAWDIGLVAAVYAASLLTALLFSRFTCTRWMAGSYPDKPADIARRAAASLGVFFILLFLSTATARIRFPFQLEWLEGQHLIEARRALKGLPIFVRPSLEFIHLFYSPLFFYVSAVTMKVCGAASAFWPLRLVSITATAASCCFIYAIVKREAHDTSAGLAAAGLYAACYVVSGIFFDLARVDPLFMAFLLASIWAARREGADWSAAAGLLLSLSFFTKQTALVAFFGLFFGLAMRSRRDALAFAGAFLTVILSVTAAGNVLTKGWFGYYVFWLPARCSTIITGKDVLVFWIEIIRSLPVACVLAGLYFWRGVAERKGKTFYAFVTIALFTGSWATRIHQGGYLNTLLPAFAALCILSGLVIAKTAGSEPRWKRVATLALLLQFMLLVYHPQKLIPQPSDVENGRKLVSYLKSLKGDVYSPAQPYYISVAGKKRYALLVTLADVMGGDPNIGGTLDAEVRQAIRDKKFSVILLPPKHWKYDLKDVGSLWKDELEEYYEKRDLPMKTRSAFIWEVNVLEVYVPK